jgi:hypothetical protein
MYSFHNGEFRFASRCSDRHCCQCHYDPLVISQADVLAILLEAECLLPDSVSDFQFPGRKITFPIALDDQWSRDALQRYMRTTRDRAIYLPSNIDYLARNNGLDGGPAEALQKLTDSPWVCISHDRCVLTLKPNEARLWRRILSRVSILGSRKAVTTESIWLLTVE